MAQEEKLTVSTLSQAAASIAGGTLANNADGAIIAAKTAKDAVENNELSIRDNERVSKLEENLNKRGYLYPAELEEAKKLLEKSDLVDFLRSEEQKNKGKTHPELKKYLDAYLSEIAWDIVHTEAKNGVRVTHEEAMKRLYEVDLSKQMKPYYPALENAIAKDKVLNDNWSRKLDKSNLEAIALFGGPSAGTALVKGVTAVENASGKVLVSAAKVENQLNKALPVVDDALTKAYVNGQLTYADIVGKGVNGASEYMRNGVKSMGEQKSVAKGVGITVAVKGGFEAYDYINGKPLTSKNLKESTWNLLYSGGLAAATAGMPIIPSTALGVVTDWHKDNGQYDVVKTTGGNIIGSVSDSKFGNKPYSPIIRESIVNGFERVYEQIQKGDK